MSLIPNPTERLARARADLRIGLPIVLGEVLVAAIETLSADRFADLKDAGEAQLAITQRRAVTLKTPAYDGDVARLVLPHSADLNWVRAIADPADDLRHPMKGPLKPVRDEDVGPASTALALLKSAQLLPAAVLVPLGQMAVPPDLTRLDPSLVDQALEAALKLDPVISARLPLSVSTAGRLHVFRPDDGGAEHYAVEIGSPDRSKPVLSRLHSACFTGDILGSLKCDCGPQLRAALTQMGTEGEGVLLYLNQEGRGIGLANKMRAYSLQDQGFDTVEANHRLGFEDDERDFRIGSALLVKMGFSKIRLMTNNPAKIAMLEKNGLEVTERVPLIAGRTEENAEYLSVKARKSGHLL